MCFAIIKLKTLELAYTRQLRTDLRCVGFPWDCSRNAPHSEGCGHHPGPGCLVPGEYSLVLWMTHPFPFTQHISSNFFVQVHFPASTKPAVIVHVGESPGASARLERVSLSLKLLSTSEVFPKGSSFSCTGACVPTTDCSSGECRLTRPL